MVVSKLNKIMGIEKLKFREFFTNQTPDVYQFNNVEIATMYLHSSQMTVKEISHKTGKSIGELYRIIKEYGAVPNRQSTNRHNVVLFAGSGFSVSQIAELTGYSSRNVRYILKKESKSQ